MSHEGIRIVREDEARKHDHQYRELSREAVEPARVKVYKTEGTGMDIDWKDGHKSSWNFRWLRDACPCATCVEEREKDRREPGTPKAGPATLLPMFQEPPRPNTVTPTGRYAIAFGWNDGHTSGIYSWDFCAATAPAPSAGSIKRLSSSFHFPVSPLAETDAQKRTSEVCGKNVRLRLSLRLIPQVMPLALGFIPNYSNMLRCIFLVV